MQLFCNVHLIGITISLAEYYYLIKHLWFKLIPETHFKLQWRVQHAEYRHHWGSHGSHCRNIPKISFRGEVVWSSQTEMDKISRKWIILCPLYNLLILLSHRGTALHRIFSKYMTAQDTRGTPTLTKHNITLARLGNLLYLQPRSTIKVNGFFSVPCIE